jgi:hypothetical protein
VRRLGLGIAAAQLLLAGAFVIGAEARSSTLTIRLEVVHGRAEFFHRGKRLTDSNLESLCAAARSQKTDIEFVRDKMTGNDALTAILGEAQCLGATPASIKRDERRLEPKPAARTHARHRHTKGTPR